MASIEIVDLTQLPSVDGTEELYCVKGGVDYRMTTGSILDLAQPLDPTLTALSGLDGSTGFLKQTSVDSFVKAGLTATDMAALRVFVKPLALAQDGGGGFFSANLFRLAVASPSSFAAQLILHMQILSASPAKSGALYIEAPVAGQRDAAEFGANIASGLTRTHFDGSSGTSLLFSQPSLFTHTPPNVDIFVAALFDGFTSPVVSASAVLICPGDVAVTIL